MDFNLRLNCFADDKSLFSVVSNINNSSEELNRDLILINNWAFQWKMSFNPDPNKQAAEVIFSHKRNPPLHPVISFNNSPVVSVPFQKQLGLILDRKLYFDHHLKDKISKANKGIGLIRRLYNFLPRRALVKIYKSYIRPHLDYGDMIYNQPHKESFIQKIRHALHEKDCHQKP